MKLLVCLLACCGLAVGSRFTPPWMSATPGLSDPVTQCPDYPFPTVPENTVLEQMQPFLDNLAANITKLLQETESPGGVALGVVYNQTLIWMKGFGQTNKQNTSPPGEQTAFRIGSISKVFTSLMMLIARDQNILSLNDELTKHLPEFQIQNPFQTTRNFTLRQLASHMAGLPRETPCKDIFINGCSTPYAELYENIKKLKLISPPGQSPSYSNMGFGALGRALAKASGTDWEYLVQKQIIGPLELKSTGVDFTDDVKKILATGYNLDGTIAKLIDIGWEAPAGQMYSSVADLAELLKLVFRDRDPFIPNTKQLIDGETIREWMQPAYTYFDGTGYGYPWEILPSHNYSLRTKGGAINGYLSEIAFAPEIKTGFVLLQSCGCSSFTDLFTMAQTIFPQMAHTLQYYQPYNPGPDWPQNYTGVYSNPTVPGLVNVKTDFVSLSATIPGMATPVNMKWLNGDTFQLTVHGTPHTCATLSGGFVGEYVYFTKKPNAMAESFIIPGLMYDIVFTRVK